MHRERRKNKNSEKKLEKIPRSEKEKEVSTAAQGRLILEQLDISEGTVTLESPHQGRGKL